jgi:hypothetical protein
MGQDEKCPILAQLETTDVSDPSPFALAVSISSLLAKTARYALSSRGIAPKTPPWDPTSDFAAISSRLASYEARFRIGEPIHPAVAFRGQISKKPVIVGGSGHLVLANALWHLCHCLLHHPVLLLQKSSIKANDHGRRNFLRRAFEAATEHSVALSELLRGTQAAGCALQMSIYGYCAVTSSTIHILNLHSSKDFQREKARELLESDKQLLKELSKYWRSARIMVN